VLDFARLEKGGPSYRLEERDLAAVVDEAVQTFRAPREGFSVRVVHGPDPLTARVDVLGVEQIVHNLLDNAAKYAGSGTEVVLRRDGRRALLEVKDSGPGIATADLPHVFETFYRGPAATETPGTGLGLAIVRQIAEAHGGSVRVASAPAQGATFTVEIPLCRDSSS
jgi:two-component system sensor histidine kinase MprB